MAGPWAWSSWYVPTDVGACAFPSCAPELGAPCDSTIARDAGLGSVQAAAFAVFSVLALLLALELHSGAVLVDGRVPVRAAQLGLALLEAVCGVLAFVDYRGLAGVAPPGLSYVAGVLGCGLAVSTAVVYALQTVALVWRVQALALGYPVGTDRTRALNRAAAVTCACLVALTVAAAILRGFAAADEPTLDSIYAVWMATVLVSTGVALWVGAAALRHVQRVLEERHAAHDAHALAAEARTMRIGVLPMFRGRASPCKTLTAVTEGNEAAALAAELAEEAAAAAAAVAIADAATPGSSPAPTPTLLDVAVIGAQPRPRVWRRSPQRRALRGLFDLGFAPPAASVAPEDDASVARASLGWARGGASTTDALVVRTMRGLFRTTLLVFCTALAIAVAVIDQLATASTLATLTASSVALGYAGVVTPPIRAALLSNAAAILCFFVAPIYLALAVYGRLWWLQCGAPGARKPEPSVRAAAPEVHFLSSRLPRSDPQHVVVSCGASAAPDGGPRGASLLALVLASRDTVRIEAADAMRAAERIAVAAHALRKTTALRAARQRRLEREGASAFPSDAAAPSPLYAAAEHELAEGCAQ